VPKNGRADADMGGTARNGLDKILAHAHGQDVEMVRSERSCRKCRKQRLGLGKDRTGLFRIFKQRSHGHQTADPDTWLVSKAGCTGYQFIWFKTMLGCFVGRVDLQEDIGHKSGFGAAAGNFLQQFG